MVSGSVGDEGVTKEEEKASDWTSEARIASERAERASNNSNNNNNNNSHNHINNNEK